jgi:hypothetical protein
MCQKTRVRCVRRGAYHCQQGLMPMQASHE